MEVDAQFYEPFDILWQPARYKVLYGGRGSGKSWQVARALVIITARQYERVLCTRELQNSISDSVHKLLTDQIEILGLARQFKITNTYIECPRTGAVFIYKGLRNNTQEIKSTEGITKCWVEEAQTVSKESWQVLIPTIRNAGSEIWVTFNPGEETDPTYQRFVVQPPPGTLVRKANFSENPWFPKELQDEEQYLLSIDPEAHAHVWLGETISITDAQIFGRRVSVDRFEAPTEGVRFHYGVDWGFANDPTAIVRCWVRGDELMVDYEAFGHHVELDDLWKLFAGNVRMTDEQAPRWSSADADKYPGIPGIRDWPLKADNARPETISYMARQGFNITAADKWPGSVEDGITHLKGFRRIVIHERCKHLREEARLYRYKLDPKTQEILPVIVDKHNHGWDALRYALDGYIQRRGANAVWEQLAR
ncbi:MAG: PBSX family phage terminase large subunit [Rhodospirillales bacterium]|nr:PBSX family phage terminase large subunit [Rhodospirillales bacterium]